jgi:uncharacterized protein YPO0396
MQQNEQEQRALENSADRLRTLREMLKTAEAEYAEHDRKIKQFSALMGEKNRLVQNYENDLRHVRAQLEPHPPETWEDERQAIEREYRRRHPQNELRLENVRDVQDDMRSFFSSSATSYLGQFNKVQGRLATRIADFRTEYRVETDAIGSGIDALPELRLFLQRIERDDLPRHRARFKDMLDKKVRDNIAGFQQTLEDQVERYTEVIAHLNGSLREIPYEGDSVYIQLQALLTRDAEIGEFRSELRACLSDATADSHDALNKAYERVRTLIAQFEDPAKGRWREKVTDVRMWLNFAAQEIWRDDGTQKRYHDDSSGMSGGQKAKLAYTILASAVAYQYGTHTVDAAGRSFRFVVIDEAFSKVDDDNARYAMALFEQLGLQLLVITPRDKIHVVERFVSAYHFVYNDEEGKDSRIINLTAEQFQAQRESWQASAGEQQP